jgi:hypothetical protein
MTQPTDKQQAELLKWEEEQRKKREREQGEITDGPTTQKINKKLSEAEQRILQQFRDVYEKVQEHDGILNFHSRKLGVRRRAT